MCCYRQPFSCIYLAYISTCIRLQYTKTTHGAARFLRCVALCSGVNATEELRCFNTCFHQMAPRGQKHRHKASVLFLHLRHVIVFGLRWAWRKPPNRPDLNPAITRCEDSLLGERRRPTCTWMYSTEYSSTMSWARCVGALSCWKTNTSPTVL